MLQPVSALALGVTLRQPASLLGWMALTMLLGALDPGMSLPVLALAATIALAGSKLNARVLLPVSVSSEIGATAVLRWRGLRWRWGRVGEGMMVCDSEGDRVEVALPSGNALWATVACAHDARRLLEAAGVDASRRRVAIRAAEAPTPWLCAALFGTPMMLVALIACASRLVIQSHSLTNASGTDDDAGCLSIRDAMRSHRRNTTGSSVPIISDASSAMRG